MAIQLLINEPSIGWTDRTSYLWIGDGAPSISYGLQRGERGPLALPFILADTNTYAPTIGRQVKLVDNGTNVWVGTIEDYEYLWVGQDGWRGITLNCVTYKQSLDTLRVTPRAYSDTTAGAIITDLLTNVFTSLPFALGTVSAGADITSLTLSYDLLSDVIQALATQSGFIWDIDPTPSTPEFFFRLPNTVTSPVTLITSDLQWESLNYQVRRGEFRDRQIIRMSFAAFAPSHEVFAGDGHTTAFTLRNPVDHLMKSTLTTSERATGTGIYSGQPNNGDTVSVNNLEYEFVNTLDNTQFGQVLIDSTADLTWTNFMYAINADMAYAGIKYSLPTWENSLCNIDEIDTANNQFVIYVKVPGAGGTNLPLSESCANFLWYGGSDPATPGPPPDPLADASADNPVTFAQVLCRIDPANNETCTIGGLVYTFKTVVNNSNAREVLIAQSRFNSLSNLADAVNRNPLTAGTAYSSATTANPTCRIGVIRPYYGVFLGNLESNWANVLAINPTPGSLSPTYPVVGGPQFVSCTPTAAGADDITAAGEITTSAGAGTGVTADPEANVQWATGSDLIICATPPASGQYLSVSYYRIGADCIAAENSTLVATRAAAEGGTGRYDQLLDDSQNTNALDGLAKIQGALSVYGTFPETVTFETYTQGLIPGDKLPISLVKPIYAPGLLNSGTWIIQEVRATYIPWFAFKYSVTLISATQVQSDVQLFERLAQTGGSGIGTTGPARARGVDDGGGGSGGNTIEPVEESLSDQIDGFSNIFLLRWVPRFFPYPSHQITLVRKNGVTLNPFGWGSPAIDPDYTILENQITFRVTPVTTDWITVLYWPDVGVPQLGTLQSTAVFTVVNQLAQSAGAIPQAEITSVTPDSENPTILNGTNVAFSRTSSTATWNISDYSGSLPPMGSVYVQHRYGQSINGADETGTWSVYDVYLDFTYQNADPDGPDIIVRYRPTTYTNVFPVSQCTITASVGPPTATLQCNFTSGLSDLGTLRWTGWQESQRFYDT